MSDRTPVIVAAKRTPIGKFMGGLSRVPAPLLGSYAVKAALDAAPGAADHVQEVIMGCVLQASLGQNPARQAALKAGLPDSMNCWTVNKVCGSGLQSAMLAAQAIKAGDIDCAVAGGLESMSLAPHMVYARAGVKYGEAKLLDHMAHDGLTCAFECWPMGNAAEHTAAQMKITRADQDAWSARSNQLAAKATQEGWFKSEIAPVSAEQAMQKQGVEHDEGFRADSTTDTLAKLRPAFQKDGTVTAGNASQISDGGAAVVMMTAAKAKELGLPVLARVRAYHTAGVAPKDLFTAPGFAVPAALEKAGMTVNDVDLFEINEAFAAQTIANMRQAEIPEDKVNLCGGAIALGHPIGASGARVFVTLLNQMNRLNKSTGVA
ncbi:MAG: thiolase family protein, partial [Phycisphaerales bacterium]